MERAKNLARALLVAVALLGGGASHAQRQPAVLEDQAAAIGALLRALPNVGGNPPSLRQRMFDISKALHKVQEDAMRANIEVVRSGGDAEPQLVRLGNAAAALDLARTLAEGYLDTRNPRYLAEAELALAMGKRLMLP